MITVRGQSNMNLYKLAKLILVIEGKPISKVRFAKTIYFVHKELIRINCLDIKALRYIRMPLGPVPDGFMELATNYRDILTITGSTSLAYNSTNYYTKSRRIFQIKNPLYKKVEQILTALRQFSTAELVELSHLDPSWKRHNNSDMYYITDHDLRTELPTDANRDPVADEDHLLQASLVTGMLEDIVSESTALEYPENGSR